MKKISIIGMGYVGLPLAVAFQKYYKVTGFDSKKSRINDLKKGIDTNNQYTKKNISNCSKLYFTDQTNDLNNSDIFIVTVPTPIYKNKKPNLKMLSDSSKFISKFLSKIILLGENFSNPFNLQFNFGLSIFSVFEEIIIESFLYLK